MNVLEVANLFSPSGLEPQISNVLLIQHNLNSNVYYLLTFDDLFDDSTVSIDIACVQDHQLKHCQHRTIASKLYPYQCHLHNRVQYITCDLTKRLMVSISATSSLYKKLNN